MTDKLRLRAADAIDLAVISACLQDARIPLREMAYDPTTKQFMAAFTRYRRELQADPTSCEGLAEIASVLIFEGIESVKHRGLDPDHADVEHSLLTIATEPGREHLIHIELVFEGDAGVQLRTNAIACRLQDFGEALPCGKTPCDHFAQASYADMAGHGDAAR